MKSKFENRNLCQWIPCINMLLSSIGTYEIKHVFREGNRIDDTLANLGIDEQVQSKDFDSSTTPKLVRDLIDSDRG
ncbi:hypothetical protein SUGI_0299060 [Cryptomeria japonica]|nr:hypothetical protein SUGI_0299060 [Cryptomeria japonica]